MKDFRIRTVAVLGAGAMGQGIAQVCAFAGSMVVLFDVSTAALEKGMAAIKRNLESLALKGKITDEELTIIISRISTTDNQRSVKADLIIEAVVENLEIKRQLLQNIERVNDGKAILATNTSSLSVAKIAQALKWRGRFLGVHFFNPAPQMKLVEIISGDKTDLQILETVKQFLVHAGKTLVSSADHPGFIVNRVARHFYLESLKLMEENAAGPKDIDLLLRSAGFRMGPFELMDLIGIDINYAVSVSVYEAFYNAPRFKPSKIQRQKIDAGELGRKTGRGFFEY